MTLTTRADAVRAILRDAGYCPADMSTASVEVYADAGAGVVVLITSGGTCAAFVPVTRSARIDERDAALKAYVSPEGGA